MSNKKKNLVILLSITGLLVILLVVLVLVGRNSYLEILVDKEVFVPEFMSEEEKASLGISEDINIQVMGRQEDGEVSVYKVLQAGEEAVDFRNLGPISPREQKID